MEVKILKNLDPEDLERQIASYHSTGWRMEGELIVVYIGREEIDGSTFDRVLYIQKIVRD